MLAAALAVGHRTCRVLRFVVVLVAGEVQIDSVDALGTLERDTFVRVHLAVVSPNLGTVRGTHVLAMAAADYKTTLRMVDRDVAFSVGRTDEKSRTVRTVEQLKNFG